MQARTNPSVPAKPARKLTVWALAAMSPLFALTACDGDDIEDVGDEIQDVGEEIGDKIEDIGK
jgi:hypothetical protein